MGHWGGPAGRRRQQQTIHHRVITSAVHGSLFFYIIVDWLAMPTPTSSSLTLADGPGVDQEKQQSDLARPCPLDYVGYIQLLCPRLAVLGCLKPRWDFLLHIPSIVDRVSKNRFLPFPFSSSSSHRIVWFILMCFWRPATLGRVKVSGIHKRRRRRRCAAAAAPVSVCASPPSIWTDYTSIFAAYSLPPCFGSWIEEEE